MATEFLRTVATRSVPLTILPKGLALPLPTIWNAPICIVIGPARRGATPPQVWRNVDGLLVATYLDSPVGAYRWMKTENTFKHYLGFSYMMARLTTLHPDQKPVPTTEIDMFLCTQCHIALPESIADYLATVVDDQKEEAASWNFDFVHA